MARQKIGIIKGLRKHIGTIVASFGFVLLCILTFGDLGDILTEAYWKNVLDNLTSISFMSIALIMIQVSIKQGVSEQFLQKGMAQDDTIDAFEAHKKCIDDVFDREIYLPYFLQVYNERQTKIEKRNFIIDNGYKSERNLFLSNKQRDIEYYNSIHINITAARIKWATTEIKYDKRGNIQTLREHRRNRLLGGLIWAVVGMIGGTLLARGLFFEESEVELWEKFVKLGLYIFVMAITVLPGCVKEYEKGAFGVPNELTEINRIWKEFAVWTIPTWVIEEVTAFNEFDRRTEEVVDERERINIGTDIQTKQTESESIRKDSSYNVLDSVDNGNTVLYLGYSEQSG